MEDQELARRAMLRINTSKLDRRLEWLSVSIAEQMKDHTPGCEPTPHLRRAIALQRQGDELSTQGHDTLRN